MSVTAPWISISIDWMDSEMLEDATDGGRLAWLFLLCHVKVCGRAGKVAWRENAPKVMQRRYRLSARSVAEMLDFSTKARAIKIEEEVLTVVNWRVYQRDKIRGTAQLSDNRAFCPDSTITITGQNTPLTPQGGDVASHVRKGRGRRRRDRIPANAEELWGDLDIVAVRLGPEGEWTDLGDRSRFTFSSKGLHNGSADSVLIPADQWHRLEVRRRT